MTFVPFQKRTLQVIRSLGLNAEAAREQCRRLIMHTFPKWPRCRYHDRDVFAGAKWHDSDHWALYIECEACENVKAGGEKPWLV